MFDKFKETQHIAYKIVENTLNNKHYAHAYIIETNGCADGLDFAKSFAKALLCPKYNSVANCDNCNQCKMIDDNNFPELKIIDSSDSIIKKEELIDLQDEFSKKPLFGTKKVYIINKAYKLNINTSNAILKFIEEPQDGIIAILVTDNIYQLINTIVSRCQVISLVNNNKIEGSTLEKIGRLLTDNKTDFDLFINDEKSKVFIENVIKFIKYYEENGKKILLYMNEYWFEYFNDKNSINDALMLVIYFYKDIINYKVGNQIEIYNDYLDMIQKIEEKNKLENIANKITIINKNRQYIENNANLTLLMDRIIIELEEGVK